MAGKETILKVKADTSQAQKSLGDLEKEFDDLNNQIKEVPVNSKKFNELSKELAQVGREIKNAELAFESLDNEQVASEIGSVAGAVGDVSAAFVLLGDDSESMQEVAKNIETALGVSMAFKGAIEGISSARKLLNNSTVVSNTLQKINTAQTHAAAIATGVYNVAVGASTGALKLLRLAMLGTGIGVLIAGLGLLIANFDKVIGVVKDTVKWLGMVTGFIEEVDLAAAAMAGAQQRAAEEANNAAQETIKANERVIESDKNRAQALVDGLDFEIRKRRAAGEDTVELERQKLNVLIQSSAKQLELIQENVNALENAISKQEEQAGRVAALFDIEIAKNKARLNAQKTTQEETQKIQEKAIQDLEIFEIEQTKIEREERAKRSAQRKADNDKAIEEEKRKQKEIFDALMKRYADEESVTEAFRRRQLTDEQRQIDDLTNRLNKELEMAGENNELKLLLEEEYQNNVKAIQDEFAAKREAAAAKEVETTKETTEAKEEIEELSFNDRLVLAENLNGSLSALNNSLLEAELAGAGDNEEKKQEIRKKAFKRQKALDLADATIQGIKAVQSALASPFPFNIALAAINGATAAANIAKIASVQFEGESGAGAPSGGLGNTARATGGANVPQVTNTTTTIGEPTKVFVSEQDITNTQNRVTVAEQQGTL